MSQPLEHRGWFKRLVSEGRFDLFNIVAPASPAVGRVRVYAEGNCLKFKKSDGTVVDLCVGGSGVAGLVAPSEFWIKDDFPSRGFVRDATAGAAPGGNIGELGWTYMGPNAAYDDGATGVGAGDANHPGVFILNAPSAGCSIDLDFYKINQLMLGGETFDMYWVAKFLNAGIKRCGLGDENAGDTVRYQNAVNKITFELSAGSVKGIVKQASEQSVTLHTADGAWHTYRARRLGTQRIGFSFDGGAEQEIDHVQADFTNIKVIPFAYQENATFPLDFFSVRVSGLSR